MLVTNDKFELPLSAPLTPVQIAERVGISERTVRFYGTAKYKRLQEEREANRKREFRAVKEYKIIPIVLDDKEDD